MELRINKVIRDGEPTGKYEVKWRDLNNRERQRTTSTRWEAENIAAEIRTELLTGVPANSGIRTFGDFCEQLIETINCSDSYRSCLRGAYVRHMKPTIGSIRLKDLRKTSFGKWKASIAHFTPASQETAYRYLHSILQYAVEDELLPANPLPSRKQLKMPAVPSSRVFDVWNADTVRRVIDELPPWTQAAAITAAGCGLRFGEVFGLTVPDLDFLRGVVHVRQQLQYERGNEAPYRHQMDLPKYGKTREVPMPAWVRNALAEHLNRYPAKPIQVAHANRLTRYPTDNVWSLVFTSQRGFPMYAPTFYPKIWNGALQRAGLPVIRANKLHMLRHYYATELITGGMHPGEIADVLGHSGPQITLRTYTHFFNNHTEKAKSIVDSIWSSDPKTLADNLRT